MLHHRSLCQVLETFADGTKVLVDGTRIHPDGSITLADGTFLSPQEVDLIGIVVALLQQAHELAMKRKHGTIPKARRKLTSKNEHSNANTALACAAAVGDPIRSEDKQLNRGNDSRDQGLIAKKSALDPEIDRF